MTFATTTMYTIYDFLLCIKIKKEKLQCLIWTFNFYRKCSKNILWLIFSIMNRLNIKENFCFTLSAVKTNRLSLIPFSTLVCPIKCTEYLWPAKKTRENNEIILKWLKCLTKHLFDVIKGGRMRNNTFGLNFALQSC